MKPHMKVIQRNGVDIFVTSSMTMKATKSKLRTHQGSLLAVMNNAIAKSDGCWAHNHVYPAHDIFTSNSMNRAYFNDQRMINENFTNHVDSIKSPN